MLDDVSPGQVLGRYELLLPVAKGGMASVWAARLKGTHGFEKVVAIKTMLPGLVDDPSFQRMFQDEATMASQVRHPHVIEILDLGEQDGILYLVMEWVSGEPLNVIMSAAATRGGIPFPVAVHIATQICRGLHAAHELRARSGGLVGLVHRDVSPQNVLVTFDGVVKIVDFGVAKATARLDAQTEAGQLKGKIAYMSPEQLRGERIDRRTDVFAMGILLYMMTTGKHPFRGEERAQTVARISSEEPAILPSKLVAGYPPRLEGCVMQALAKDANKRYSSANDMLLGLARALPSGLRESTDEEVAEFVRRLLPDRLERQQQAIKDALELADRRETPRSELRPPQTASTATPDEPATVLEGIGREVTPSADGRSLPGASSTAPPPSTARPMSARRRNLLLLSSAGILMLGGGVGFLWGQGENPSTAVAAPPARAPVSVTPPAEPLPREPALVPSASIPPPARDPVPALSASGGSNVRPPSGRRTGATPTAKPTRNGPFVSPIRNPGF